LVSNQRDIPVGILLTDQLNYLATGSHNKISLLIISSINLGKKLDDIMVRLTA